MKWFNFKPYYSKTAALVQLGSIILSTTALLCIIYAYIDGVQWNEHYDEKYDDANWRHRVLFYVIAYENKTLHLLDLPPESFEQYYRRIKYTKEDIKQNEEVETRFEFIALSVISVALPILIIHLILCFVIKKSFYRKYMNFFINLLTALLFLGAFFLELMSCIINKNRTYEIHHLAETELYGLSTYEVPLELPLYHVCQRKALSKLSFKDYPYVKESKMCPQTELKLSALGLLMLSSIATFLLCCMIFFCIYPQRGTEETTLEESDEEKLDGKITAGKIAKRKRKPTKIQFLMNNRNELFEWGSSSTTTDENENKSPVQIKKDQQYALIPLKYDNTIPEYSSIRRPKK